MLVLMEISDAGVQQGLQVKKEMAKWPTQIYFFIDVFDAISCMKHITQIQTNLMTVSCLIKTYYIYREYMLNKDESREQVLKYFSLLLHRFLSIFRFIDIFLF